MTLIGDDDSCCEVFNQLRREGYITHFSGMQNNKWAWYLRLRVSDDYGGSCKESFKMAKCFYCGYPLN